MLNRKVKPGLQAIRARLDRWAVEVPARALRFHEARVDLEKQVSAVESRWIPPRGEELKVLTGQADRLEELAASLTALIRQAEELEKEAQDLRVAAERSADPILAGWLADRSIDWQSTLRRLGVNVGRLIELEPEEPVLARTRERIREHAEAARGLDEARQLLARLGSTMQTAGLEADLPLLRERLFSEGAGAAWRAALERAVAPVRALDKLPPPEPPRALQQAPSLLAEARRWERVLGLNQEKASELQERLRIAEAEWGQWSEEKIRDLLDDVSHLLAALRKTAAERHGEALSLLKRRRSQLAAACGPNPELEREIDDLADLADPANASTPEPEAYEDWRERQAVAARHLLDAASFRLIDLQEWIGQRRHELAGGLETLKSELLSAQDAREAAGLRLDLQNLPDPFDQAADEIFGTLETLDRVWLALDRLQKQARTDREDLAARERALLDRLEPFRELLGGSLRPEVRREAEELVGLLAERSWEALLEPAERRRRLLDLQSRCDTLLARLTQDDREARARADSLRQWLRKFNGLELDSHCPEELVRRASSLIAAIPADPPSWSGLAGHLEAAEALARSLETHGLRVVAARLDRAVPDLERQARTTRDPVHARRIRELLDELAACDESRPVPPGLTARLLLLAPEREGSA